ncbi:MAG TPA: ribokinase [Verrucomicrobiota bacterium]|nr:ribokinase [Verrucomicrobiota bacterium]
MKPKIIVVGSSNTDMVVKTSHLPGPGETVIGGEFITAAGGKGANQAVAAARAGGDVYFVAKVGDDHFGKSAIDGFKKEKIKTDYVYTDKKLPSGVALIVVDEKGENAIAVAPGANSRLSPNDIKKAQKVIKSAKVLLVQLEIPLQTVIEAVNIASSCGIKTILNPAPAMPLPDELLSKISIITPNEIEAEILTGIKIVDEQTAKSAAITLKKKGVDTVIITLGEKGAYLHNEDTSKLIPSIKVKAVDTTAAGDIFNGALAVSIAEEKQIIQAVRFANIAAAISVTKIGAQPSAPKRNQILRLLNQTAN